MKIVSQGWSLEVHKVGVNQATMVAIEPGNQIHSIDVHDIHVQGDMMTGSATIVFMQPIFTMVTRDDGINVSITHSWFADGDHWFPLGADDVKQVRQFLKGFT